MNLLKFKYNFWKLKRQYKSLIKVKEKYNIKNIEREKFIKFFIKDEEDKILNKKFIEDFNKKIQKYKIKIYKLNNTINRLLFSLGITDINYIDYLYQYKISKEDFVIIKEIFKEKSK